MYIFHGFMWKMHKKHHDFPGSTKHLITPLFYLLSVEFLFFCLYSIISTNIAYALINGQSFVYILFEYIHFISHHRIESLKILSNNRYLTFLTNSHKKHHCPDNDNKYCNFGFVTMFWDWVFSTYSK